MLLKPHQLGAQLRRDLQPLYWLSGDEPLLLQEAADQVRAACRNAGFVDREVMEVDRGFDWLRFRHATDNLSLFGDRRRIELRLNEVTPDDVGRQALLDYLEDRPADLVVIITGPRLEAATLKTKWFKAIESAAVVVQIWPLSRQELPEWLTARLRSVGLDADGAAVQTLVERVEGNLLAAAQEVEKLRLMLPTDTRRVGVEAIQDAVADSARFSVFQLVDAVLLGDARRGIRVLNGLRSEGVQPLQVVGALTHEFLRLSGLCEAVAAGQSVNAVVEAAHLPYPRRAVVTRALQRLQAPRVYRQFDRLRQADQRVKGLRSGDPWRDLIDVARDLGAAAPSHS